MLFRSLLSTPHVEIESKVLALRKKILGLRRELLEIEEEISQARNLATRRMYDEIALGQELRRLTPGKVRIEEEIKNREQSLLQLREKSDKDLSKIRTAGDFFERLKSSVHTFSIVRFLEPEVPDRYIVFPDKLLHLKSSFPFDKYDLTPLSLKTRLGYVIRRKRINESFEYTIGESFQHQRVKVTLSSIEVPSDQLLEEICKYIKDYIPDIYYVNHNYQVFFSKPATAWHGENPPRQKKGG